MMKKTTYQQMTDGLRHRKALLAVLTLLNKLLPAVVVGIYGAVLFCLLLALDRMFVPCVAVPAVSFAALTELRARWNKPRPYEVFDCEPAFPRHKEGKSFPSRHVFSAFVIGTTLCFVSAPIGATVLCCGVLLAVLRVVGGVHFIKDVFCGAAIGVLCGLLLFIW